ncbi:MAG: hypothetical protein LBT53_05225 [Puniceicoccales bacterium]|jgi:uncharacterized repeat protein (TIGR04138 family)|nr:hypothetical protein [Puniceicoccales bacterium]
MSEPSEPADYSNDPAFAGAVEKIIASDPRFARGAYYFVRTGLDHTVKGMTKSTKPPKAGVPRSHVTARQLLNGLCEFALEQYGPMSLTLFARWGITTTDDIGAIVFNLIEANILGRSNTDSRDDFKNTLDLKSELHSPFTPQVRTRLCVLIAAMRAELPTPEKTRRRARRKTAAADANADANADDAVADDNADAADKVAAAAPAKKGKPPRHEPPRRKPPHRKKPKPDA